MTSRRWLAVALVAVALVLLAGRALASLYVEYQWFASLDALPLWRARVSNTLLLRGLSGATGALFVFANLYAVRLSVVSLVLPRRVANLEIGEEVPSRYLFIGVAVTSLLLGALLTIPQEGWTTLGLARYGQPFSERDPYFQLDLGFYVYWLPFETSMYFWSLIALLLATAVVVVLYALTPSLRLERGRLRTSSYVRRHFSVLGALMLAILAWSYRLDAFALLSQGSGPDGIFAYVDHHVNVQVNLVLALLTLASAVLVLWAGWTGQIRVAFVTVTSVIVLSLLLRQLLPVLVQRAAAPADPAAREYPYIATRAGYTRRAFAVDRLTRAQSVAYPSLAASTRGITVWDLPSLVRASGRMSRSGESPAGSAGWALTNTGVQSVLVSPQMTADPSAVLAPWSYVRYAASRSDERGAPVASTVRAVGGAGSAGGAADELPLPPAIVHDSTGGYVIVPDSAGVLRGATLEHWFDRLAHAWSQQNVRLLVSDLPHPSPKMIRRLDVRERVGTLVPFFTQGSVVAPIVAREELYWAIDLYSTSSNYPLSRRFLIDGSDWSYLHHAGTAIVHAHTGRVWVVLEATLDPVAQSWRARFPAMFVTWAALPREIALGMPPAVDGALAQAAAFARYGARGESPARGQLPRTLGADSVLASATPPIIALPGEPGVLAASIPVTDSANHVTGLVLATGGAQRASLWYETDMRGPRWTRILEQLQRQPDSIGVLPPDTRGARGAIRAVPVAGGIVYAQPMYAWRTAGAPTLARVTILYGDSVYAGASLDDAAGVVRPETPASDSPADFRARVQSLYDAMRVALTRGDWVAFGEAYEALGKVLGRTRR